LARAIHRPHNLGRSQAKAFRQLVVGPAVSQRKIKQVAAKRDFQLAQMEN
jgi:hypothetical protein